MPRFEGHSAISPVTETEAGLAVGWGPGWGRVALGWAGKCPTRGILSCSQEGPELSKRQ